MDATSEQAASCRSVLVVDDSSVECMLATAVLQKLGFSVACVASAEAALLMLAVRRFDLAICDISLPGMDGLALLANIRACPAPPPCIVLSAHDDTQHALAALRGGARAYLVKPLRLNTMRDTLEKIFPQAPAARDTPSLLISLGACAAEAPRLQRRLLAGLLRVFSRNARPTAGAVARPVRSAAAALPAAGIRATG